MPRHYRNNDPRIIQTKFKSVCAKCAQEIPIGINVIYYPLGKKVYHQECGWDDYLRSREAIQDEDEFNNRSL